MTKKFWNNWQLNIYRTDKIVLTDEGKEKLIEEYGTFHLLHHLVPEQKDRIVDATFFGDQVLLNILKFSKRNNRIHKTIIKPLLNRKDIVSVQFR